MLKIVRKSASIQFAILLSLATAPALYSQPDVSTEPWRIQLVLKSVLLSKRQCEMAIKGYRERIAPYFIKWRDEYRESLARFETHPTFTQQEKQVEEHFENLSKRARTGVVKDCETLLRQLSERYPE